MWEKIANGNASNSAHPSALNCYPLFRRDMIPDLKYMQALRECCKDEAAFERLKQILNPAVENVEEIVSQYPTQVTSDYSWENLLHAEIALHASELKFEKPPANKQGIIFNLINRNEDSCRWLLFAHSGCQELLELESKSHHAEPTLLYNLIHPEDRADYEQSISISADKLQPWIWEGRVITKEGKIKWLQSAARPIVTASCDIFWNGLLIDITSRKASEEALLLSEQKFSIAFRHSPDSIIISTLREGRFIDINDSFLRVSGYSREEVVGRTSLELNSWVNREERVRIQQILQQQGAVYNEEVEFRRKCGGVTVALYSAEVVNINGEQCVLAVVTDITSRKQAETQLRAIAQSDRLLGEIALKIRRSLDLNEILNTTVEEVRQLLQADRVFISYFDENGEGRVVAESVGANFPPILGWVTDNNAYKEIKEIFNKYPIRIVNDAKQENESDFIAEYHNKFQIKAGIGVPIMLGEQLFGLLIANQCSAPRNWQQCEINLLDQLATQVAIAIQQSSLFKQLQELNSTLESQVEERTAQLQQAVAELQELNRLKDVVLHTVSHDFRTSVMGNLMVLNNLLKSQDEKITLSRSIVERMIQGNERQLGTIDSLLETHTTEDRGVVLQRTPVEFGALTQAIIKDLQPLLSTNKAAVKNLVPSDLPLVMADPTQLQRVVANLLNHALKHNPPGLKLTFKATVEGKMIRCTIEDKGVGMSQLECDRLFDLYVRDPQSRCSTGIGLKLYLCLQIITAHGGEIGVTSRPNRGSTFWFTLPLA